MPQTTYFDWDQVFLLKLTSIAEMTVSSMLLLLYGYLSVLQGWTATPDTRSDILQYKSFVAIVTAIDFGLGSLLAYASNLIKRYRRPKVILWIIMDSLLLPVSLFVLTRLYHDLKHWVPLSTDVHVRRTVLVHILYSLMHLLFIMEAIHFLAYYTPKVKRYDPLARPDSVFEPTDPKITTTESRHIRFSESFLQTNIRKSSDLEASTRAQSQIELRSSTSEKQHFESLSLLPLITSFWLERLSWTLNRYENKRIKELAALIKLRTHSENYQILAILEKYKLFHPNIKIGYREKLIYNL